ncbi:YHS domain-containing protein [Sphingopyxis chilensis]
MHGLTQNWSWILIVLAVVAAFFFFVRRGRRHGGSDFDGNRRHRRQRDLEDADRGGVPRPQQQLPDSVVDPVSGAAVRTAGAITSVYQGKAYYFASKENRDRFEAAPQDYANKVQGIPMAGNADRPRSRHHGS